MDSEKERRQAVINDERERIARHHERAERQREAIDPDDPETVNDAANTTAGLGSKYVGLVKILLRQEDFDPDEIRTAVNTAADQYLDALRIPHTLSHRIDEHRWVWNSHAVRAWETLYVAVLSKDPDRQQAAAEATFAIPDEYVDVFPEKAPKYYYAQALATTVVDDARARDYVTQTAAAVSAHAEFDSIAEPGMYDALAGIVDDDGPAVEDGIATHVESHRTNQPSEVDPDDVPDFRATAMTILARQHGLDIAPDGPNVPETLL